MPFETMPPTLALPTPRRVEESVAQAQRLFLRTVCAWTGDLLALGRDQRRASRSTASVVSARRRAA